MTQFNSFLLQLSIIFPFVMGLIMLTAGGAKNYYIKWLSFLGFSIPCLIAIWLFYQYQIAEKVDYSYAFFSDLYTGLQHFGISLKLGLNGISLPLFLLAGVVGLAAGLYAINSVAERLHLYLGLLLIMYSGLMGTFASIDVFFFYFFHELALIPTFIMIGIWGGRGRRGVAMELTIYLTLGAMLSLAGLIAIYAVSDIHSFDLITIKNYLMQAPLSYFLQKNIFGLLLFGFGILISLFPFHSWAPKGYTASPTSVAMLHAGVLKKFGLYGLVQIAAPLLPSGLGHWAYLLAILALCNIIVIGFVTMAQRDLKQMVAYSSVMHMGYAFLGIVSASVLGLGGAVLLMFAHGLSVALLFLLGTMVYHRTESYDMKSLGGLSQRTPVLCGFFVAAIFASIGLPGFANFWAEIAIFLSLFQFSPWMLYPAIAGVVISAIYGLRAISNIFFGQPTPQFKEQFDRYPIQDISLSEKVPAVILLIALLIVGFWPRLITNPLNQTFAENASEKVLTAQVQILSDEFYQD